MDCGLFPSARFHSFRPLSIVERVKLPNAALEAVRMPGRLEQPYQVIHRASYFAFLDPAGGTGSDSMTLGIAHHFNGRAVLDLLREAKPPFSPESTVAEFADVMKAYAINTATSDRYAGSWPTEAFRKVGIAVLPSERNKSEIYQDCLPLIMSGTCELLDDPKLLKQFGGLERRTARGGKDSIDHAPRQHDDVANAAAGALYWQPISRCASRRCGAMTTYSHPRHHSQHRTRRSGSSSTKPPNVSAHLIVMRG